MRRTRYHSQAESVLMEKFGVPCPELISGSIVTASSFAIWVSFDVFQIPIGEVLAEFSLAIVIQNFAAEIGPPIFGLMGRTTHLVLTRRFESLPDRCALALSVAPAAGGSA